MAVGGRRLRLVSLLAAITISGWSIFGWTGFGSDLATSASSAETVSVIESTHRVEFPHRFVLTLEARAPSNIESARVFYTIGDAPVSVYAYPTKLSHRGNLSAEFEIQTGSSGFIPQGVDVEYYYAFTDTSGRTTLSERFSFEYLDPRYRWQSLEQDDFTLMWHDMSCIFSATGRQLMPLRGCPESSGCLASVKTKTSRSSSSTVGARLTGASPR